MKRAEKRIGNYHTHTARCGHATGREEEYVLAAMEAGWQVLGFSDHAPWPYESGFINPTVRMRAEELASYCETVRALEEKYRGQIRIYLGLECEYFPAYLDWLRETKERMGLDYFILGNHFDRSDETGIYYGAATREEQIRSYADNTVRGMETGLFAALAHPDLFLMNYPCFDAAAREVSEQLCRSAKELGLALEYNLQGQRHIDCGKAKGVGYPAREFWEIAAQLGNEVIIGMDAHTPEALIDRERYAHAEEVLAELGLRQIWELSGLGR